MMGDIFGDAYDNIYGSSRPRKRKRRARERIVYVQEPRERIVYVQAPSRRRKPRSHAPRKQESLAGLLTSPKAKKGFKTAGKGIKIASKAGFSGLKRIGGFVKKKLDERKNKSIYDRR